MMRKLTLCAAATLISVIPPLLAVLSCFPLWAQRSTGAVVSGFTAMLLVIALAPILKLMSRLLSSPSVWMTWLISLGLFLALSSIAEEMIFISAVGAVSNIIGALLYRIAAKSKGAESE